MTGITRSIQIVALSAIAVFVVVAAVRVSAGSPGPAGRLEGPAVSVGGGSARTFVDVNTDGSPTAVGILFTDAAMTGLAERMNTTSRCWDKDGDGQMEHGECLGDFQSTLELPAGAADLGLPVKWATLNWNPEGHMPPAPRIWSWPHFDFHFYIADRALVESIRPGPCAEFIDCEDFETASVPLPAEHQPPDYLDVGAAVPAMGNHLVDKHDPELADPSLGFSKTFIYGAYGGRLIHLEPMISHAYLSSRPNDCAPVRTPAAYAEPGFYPTLYCVRYDDTQGVYRVSLEGLVRR